MPPTFHPPSPHQPFLRLGLFGQTGRGKTLSALLIAEGLAAVTDRRVALIDTDHGSDFYTRFVRDRAIHPEPFDVDVIYTRCTDDAAAAVRELDAQRHGILIIDCLSRLLPPGSSPRKLPPEVPPPPPPEGVPGSMEHPLFSALSTLSAHIILTALHPRDLAGFTQIAVRLIHSRRGETLGYVEQDRTGALAGRMLIQPDFGNLAMPLLSLLTPR